MSSLESLNQRFGITGQVSFVSLPGELCAVDIKNNFATARILLQGAQLVHWQPAGERPVIWLSPAAKYVGGKSLRGGVPVCWPWFGPHASEAGFPAHGVARTRLWQVSDVGTTDSGAIRVTLQFSPGVDAQAHWPYASSLELSIIVDAALTMTLVTRNESDTSITVGQALHTYFAVSDVRQCQVRGLEGVEFLDKVDNLQRKQQAGAVTIDGEVDRVYLGTASDCVIEDPQWQRRIHIAKTGSNTTVVWNPWQEKAAAFGDMGVDDYLRMLCVESANAEDDVVVLAPGGEYELSVRYSVEAQ